MNKLIVYLAIVFLTLISVSGVILEVGTIYNPSGTNAYYNVSESGGNLSVDSLTITTKKVEVVYNGITSSVSYEPSTKTYYELYIENNILTVKLNMFFEILDEITRNRINNLNMTLQIISNNFSINKTTSTGLINYTLDFPFQYELRYYSKDITDYSLRSLFLELQESPAGNLTLYSLNTSIGSNTVDITFQVFDQQLDPLEGATININRYYVNKNGYENIAGRVTDVNGEADFSVEKTNAFYTYTVYYDGRTIFTSSTAGTQFTADKTIQLFVNTDISALDKYLELKNIENTLSYTNTSNTTGYFEMTFTNPNAYNICLKIKTLGTDTIQKTCTTGVSGTKQILVSAGLITKTFIATIIVEDTTTKNEIVLNSLIITLQNKPIYQDNPEIMKMLLFISGLIALGLGIALVIIPELAIILQTIGLILLTIPPVQLIPVTASVIGWFIALGIMIIFVIRRRGQ